MTIKRYKGVVKAAFPNHAFIDRLSVVLFDGSPHDLETKHDIFVHQDDFGIADFKVGMELTFEVKKDTRSRKAGALRAEAVVFSGVEVQVPETVVDHPVVPVTWCFKPSVLEYIRAHPEKTFSLVIGAVLPDESSRLKTMEHNIGLKALKDGQSYISFFAPGTYEVYAYLVQYENNERTVRKVMNELDIEYYDPKDQDGRVLVSGWTDLRFLDDRHVTGKVLAISSLTIEVPDGIFANPMTGRAKTWFCYFWKDDLLDDCDRRAKQWFAFTLGILAFVAWEFLKRLAFFLFGFVMLLSGFKPMFAWKETFSRKLSANYYAVKYGETDELMDYSGFKDFLRPWALLVVATAVWGFFNIKEVRDAVITVFIAVIVGLMGLGAYLVWRRFFRKDEEKRRAEETFRNQQVWEQFESVVQCGAAPAKKPASVRLIFLGVKRAVCRNYRQG